jgi:hypothetical protein
MKDRKACLKPYDIPSTIFISSGACPDPIFSKTTKMSEKHEHLFAKAVLVLFPTPSVLSQGNQIVFVTLHNLKRF